jgi:F-type H+-transporting ATPase subunit delta
LKSNKSVAGYSRALFEIACEENKQELFFEQLKQLQSALTADLHAFVGNPAFTDKERRDVFTELASKMGLDHSIKAFIILVAEQSRLPRFDEIVAGYREKLYEQQGKALLEIYSAKKISAAESKKLASEFSKKVGKELEIDEHVDPNLVGGIIVKIGSQYFDGSLRGRLTKLRESLLS